MSFKFSGFCALIVAFTAGVYADQVSIQSDAPKPKVSERVMLEKIKDNPVSGALRCEGNGCDAYLPAVGHILRYEDVRGQRRLNSALGGLSGALIGEEIAGAPGALVLGAFGVAAGYHVTNKERWEKEAKAYDEAWRRGDDIVYNPAHRFPNTPHWLMAGPTIK